MAWSHVEVESRTTYAVWEDQQAFIPGASGIGRPEGNIVTVIVTLPGQVRQALFSIYVGNQSACLG